jgi:hypothetical protein
MLTPIALAHWIMGDGAKHGNGLILCTDSFTIQEIVVLMNVLIIRYDLKCTLHINSKGYKRIYIFSYSKKKLTTLVKPFIVPSMLYKLNLKN